MLDEDPGKAPLQSHWGRPRTRRAVLGGGAALAAAGAAAALVAAAQYGGGGEDDEIEAAGDENTALEPPTPKNVPIDDPRRRAAHLLRRAGFGGTPAQIDEFAALSREEGADRLLNFEAVDNSALNARLATMNLELNDYGNGLIVDMQRWWFTRMSYTARPLEERMTFIWHGLLTSQLSKIGFQRSKLLVKQNELFRSHALPKYDDLVKAVSKDPAMLYYLDTVESTRESPNENYARELMELFTMGVGNYTEADVRESARAFTGWRVTAPPRPTALPPNATQEQRNAAQRESAAAWDPQFIVQPRQHDTGQKTFLGRTGNWDGDHIVDIIMEQKATSRFMSTRLFTEFANFNPEPETIDRLAAVWDASGHQVKDVVREILVTDEFNSEDSYRAFVRGPVDFVVGAVRGLELEQQFRFADNGRGRGTPAAVAYRGMDQVLFEPHNVAGWPGGSTWLSSSTFFARVNFLDQMLFPNGRPLPIPVLAAAATPEALVDAALDRLVDGRMEPSSRDAIIAHVSTIRSPEQRVATAAYLVLASPEYQLA